MEILNVLLEVTIYSGVIFTAVMLLKTLLKNKMSPLLHYAVWAVFIVRLLVPVTISSPVRLFVIPAQTQNDAVGQQVQPQSNGPVTLTQKTAADTPGEKTQSTLNLQAQPAPALPLSTLKSDKPVAVSLPDIILAVWLAGMGAGLLYLITLYCILRRNVRRNAAPPSKRLLALFEEVKAELDIKSRIKLLCIYEYGTPALMFPHTVMMPADALVAMDDAQVKFALHHELTHYRHGDHIVSIILSLLNAVYWFNPFVWLALREMRADMETACDGSVVKTMGDDDKRRYASLIVTLFAQPRHRQLVLGMARGNTKRIAERRVRGIFMNGRSRRSVKLISALLAAVLFVACFTTACQPTPETEVVVGKNGSDLSNLIQETPTPAQSAQSTPGGSGALYDELGAPQHWSYNTEGLNGKLKINVDADVTLPNVTKLPVATARLRKFTQDDINKVAQVLLGKDVTWYKNAPMTKEEIEQSLMEEQKELSEAKSDPDSDPAMIEKLEGGVEFWTEEYQKAPSQSDLEVTDINIGKVKIDLSDNEYNGVCANAIVGGQRYMIQAIAQQDEEEIYRISVTTSKYSYSFGGTDMDAPYGVTLTKEQAAEQAKAIASQLTNELTLCYVAPSAAHKEEANRNWGWACVFMREINGCPTAYATEDVGSSMESEVQRPVHYEKMVIVMDDLGVTDFVWESPMTQTGIENDNASLKPFDEISQRAIEQLFNKYGKFTAITEGEEDSTLNVTHVELGLMRVAKQNSDDYYYLPVWNFFNELGYVPYKLKPGFEEATPPPPADENGDPTGGVSMGYPQAWGSVTINALDGSVIDRDLGY